jgi:AcrR family transcriptional regulator
MIDTRQRLVAGTLRSLRRRGLVETTSRDIAAESGVNLAGITYHFGSKDELVAEALLGTIRDWLRPALDVLSRDMDPAQRVLEAIQALQGSFEKARGLLPVYLEALVHAGRDTRLGREVRTMFRELRRFLADQIADLQGQGYLPAWVEPAAMATLLLAAADGIALHAALDPKAVDHHAVAGQALQLLMAARPS